MSNMYISLEAFAELVKDGATVTGNAYDCGAIRFVTKSGVVLALQADHENGGTHGQPNWEFSIVPTGEKS